MILANLHARLTRNDAQLVVALLAEYGTAMAGEAEGALRERGIDALLDDPRLLSALMGSTRGIGASLPLFTYIITRHALLQQGEGDRVLADYVASIVWQYGLGKRAERIADHDDCSFDTLAQLAAESESADPRRALLARAHLGNYALWLSGMFPDYIEHRRWRRGGPSLEYYETLGQLGWRRASEHRQAAELGMAVVYARASEKFAVLRQALNRVSDTLLFPNTHSPERLMRQVTDEARWRAA